MNIRKKGIVIGIIFCLFLLSCQAEQDVELTPVNLHLKWLHQSQFAGNYYALEEGYYADNGLDVTLIPFSFETYPIDEVVNGNMQFGITGGDELLIAQSQGQPVKAVAVIYRINPVCAYSLKDSGITKPQDFVGKTVGIERASDETDINVGILYAAMIEKLGLNDAEVNEVTIGYDATELIAGEVDISTGYIINEPHLAELEGYEVNTILMADYGVNMYADVLFARQDYIDQNPKIVQAMVSATLDGWRGAFGNKEKAVDYVLSYADDSLPDHEAYMLEQSVPLIKGGNKNMGVMSDDEWSMAQEILFEQGVIENKVPLTEVYTNRFVEDAYKYNE